MYLAAAICFNWNNLREKKKTVIPNNLYTQSIFQSKGRASLSKMSSHNGRTRTRKLQLWLSEWVQANQGMMGEKEKSGQQWWAKTCVMKDYQKAFIQQLMEQIQRPITRGRAWGIRQSLGNHVEDGEEGLSKP